MKTRNWLVLVIAALGTLGLVVGVGFDNLVGMSSSASSAEVETNRNATDLTIFNFDSENINQRLRDYEALNALDREVFNDTENINQRLREYEVLKAAEAQMFDFDENINLKLREYETLTQLQETPSGGEEGLQQEIRHNLPEGS